MAATSYNFTIDDSSSMLTYLPYSDGSTDGGWQPWYSVSGFNTQGGEESKGDSRHITAFPGASVSLEFHGTEIYVYGNSTSPYDVILDSQTIPQSPSTGPLLFFQTGLRPTVHFLNLTVSSTTGAPGVLSFDGAIVTDTLPVGSSSIVPIHIDNQDNSTLKYTGTWVDKSDAQIPNRTEPKPFKQTSTFGSFVSLDFTNVVAVAVNGSRNWGHGTYNISLDGSAVQYNASTWWLIGDSVLYYQSGLDPNQTHTLSVINEGTNSGDSFTLNDITLYKLNSTISNSTSAPANVAPSKHTKVGVIVGPVIAVVVVVIASIVAFLYFRRQRKPAHGSSNGEIEPFSAAAPLNQQNGDGVPPVTFAAPAVREKSSRLLANQPSPSPNSTPSPPSAPSSHSGAVATSLGQSSQALEDPFASLHSPTRSAQTSVPGVSPNANHSSPSLVSSQQPSTGRSPFNDQVDINRIVELVAQRIDRAPLDSDSLPPPGYPNSVVPTP